MSNIAVRLKRLERSVIGSGWMFVLTAPDELLSSGGFDASAFLRSQGHDVADRDLVVMIRIFSAPPTTPISLISAQPLAR